MNEIQKWPPGTEVITKYSFVARQSDDLSFNKGDILKIIATTTDANWYRAERLDGPSGFIPANYCQMRQAVSLQAMPWYHGKITREEAEAILHSTPDGSYLVRESTNFPGDFTLCVSFDGGVEHYHITNTNETKVTLDGDHHFESLIQLVEYYQKYEDGLVCCLGAGAGILFELAPLYFCVEPSSFRSAGWAIKREALHILSPLEVIGKGEFGDVLIGRLRRQKVAIKTLKDSSRTLQKFLTECAIMTQLRHINCVSLIGIVLGVPTYMILEFMCNGNLVDYLRSRGRTILSTSQLLAFAKDVCQGMLYLIDQGILHRDLAARNILLDNNLVAKISDFGLAKPIHFNQEGGKFPIKWTAPEALRNNSKFCAACDVWSYGILTWEIFSFGKVPYSRMPLSDVVKHIERGYRLECPEGCPEKIYKLMIECWNLEASLRPSFREISLKLTNIDPLL